MNFRSHPNKFLEVHIDGVLKKAQKHTDSKIIEIAVLFHDLGKINQNFQKKLDPKNKGGGLAYTEHAYLSAYAFMCFLERNRDFITNDLKSDRIKIKQIIAIIAKHHGHLPDFENILSVEAVSRLETFIKSNPVLAISEFYKTKLLQKHQEFEIRWSDNLIIKLSRFLQSDFEAWKTDALNYFMDTQFGFASLIEADKRDAGDLKEYDFDNKIKDAVESLQNSLEKKFKELTKEKTTPLNQLRTKIREEAIINLSKKLIKTNERVYTLTAPTGAGKTFTLLALASEIQRQKGNLGIIYTLPFLSITEQVQRIVEKDLGLDLLSVSSKSKNERIEKAQEALDEYPTQDNLNQLIKEDFFQQTFDHPFVLTTFVQFFETLMSNRNSTLLKLPNFKNRIFLIDEIQALPPQLYIFFTGWLKIFCEKYNSYCILSTATMPCLEIPKDRYKVYAKKFFKGYTKPNDLLDAKQYFKEPIFNRYQIDWLPNDKIDINTLANHITKQERSCLVIVNTIDDSKNLYNLLRNCLNVYLLNTHFTPTDRKKKINIAKEYLIKGQKIILISTQLIEAGVDISFPVVYRDLCPLPNLIQSAGRCNRNNELLQRHQRGQVYLFNLIDQNGKSRANLVYRQEAKEFLKFCRQKVANNLHENQLFHLQEYFFNSVAEDLIISEAEVYNYQTKQIEKIKLIDCVNDAQFERLGAFKLIPETHFGTEYQYYIPTRPKDDAPKIAYNLLEQVTEIKIKGCSYSEFKQMQNKLEIHLKEMAERIITIRILANDQKKEAPHYSDEFLGIRVLSDEDDYTFEKGIRLQRESIL